MTMTKTIAIKSFSSSQLVSLVKSLLREDGVIAVPTDTIYGLAASIYSEAALRTLFKVKDRDSRKAVAICLGDVDQVSRYSKLTISNELLEELLPGAVTLLFKQNDKLSQQLNRASDLVGIRIPDCDFIRDVCRHCGPIALTSANISSKPSCSSIDEFQELWPKLDAIFDGGTLGHIDPDKLGSTIVDLSIQGKYRIVRDGCIYDQVVQLLNKHKLESIS